MTATVYPKLYILARMEIQLASLNASGSIGNYIKLQEGYVAVRRDSGIDYVPVPVITGNALKNWHAREMASIYVNDLGGSKIHAVHFRDMMRVSLKKLNISITSSNAEDVETMLVNDCSICDVHGFLVAEELGGAARESGEESESESTERRGRGRRRTERQERVPPPRRESLIKFSFAAPPEELVVGALGRYLPVKYSVTHNRVSPEFMMVFKREYSTLEFAWQAVLDVASIGRSQLERDVSSNVWLGKPLVNERCELARRGVAAVLAFKALLEGYRGANTSRAQPILRVRELVAVLATRSIPTPLHPFYKDYASDLAKLLERYQDRVDSVYYLEGGTFASQVSEVRSLPGDKLKPARGYSVLLEQVAERVKEILSGNACRQLQV